MNEQIDEMANKRCKGYCGVACVDGSCPMANREEYEERGYDIVKNCNDCHYYKGCEDCYFDGTDMCSHPTEKGGAE